MQHTASRVSRSAFAVLLGTALALAGCAGSPEEEAAPDPAAGGGDCGVSLTVAPEDPDGVYAELSSESQALYQGYPTPVRASNWSDWAPEGDGPYKVGIAFGSLNTPYQNVLLPTLEEELGASPLVEEVVSVAAQSNEVTAQIQQYEALIQQGVDIILFQPNAGDAFIPAIDAAAAAGVPSVTIQNTVASPNAVNVAANDFATVYEATNAMLNIIGGEGDLLGVHGVPGAPSDIASFAGAQAAIDQCPGASFVGEVQGNFDPSAAKSEVLQFLATHTGEIDGVVQTAVMAPGIMSAFVESGLDVPVVTDVVAAKGSLAYWHENRETYQGVGVGYSPISTGKAMAEVTLGMLAGNGIRLADVIVGGQLIEDDNLEEWVDPSWTLATSGTADGPAGYNPLTPEYLSEIFTSGY